MLDRVINEVSLYGVSTLDKDALKAHINRQLNSVLLEIEDLESKLKELKKVKEIYQKEVEKR